jgi:hypothetical protein
MSEDLFYRTCCRSELLQDHICQADPMTGKLIEWEHALYDRGSQLQKKFAIIPICWYAHRGPGLDKEINVWIALNRATDEELEAISKSEDMIAKRNRLNERYGVPSWNVEEINLDILLD